MHRNPSIEWIHEEGGKAIEYIKKFNETKLRVKEALVQLKRLLEIIQDKIMGDSSNVVDQYS